MGASDERALRLVLGDQLFPEARLALEPATDVFMTEDMGLCTNVRHHQQKIVMVLSAMRCYRDRLVASGHRVHYTKLERLDRRSFEEKLLSVVESTGATRLEVFEIEDVPVEARIRRFAAEHRLALAELESPMFLTRRAEFEQFVAGRQTVRMADFYRWQRRRLDLLLDDAGGPAGGRWSYDELNRKKLPARVDPPAWPSTMRPACVDDVSGLVQSLFPDHPGNARDFAWPVTREGAIEWLQRFVRERLKDFGPYEDAISSRSPVVFHSMLSPSINIGLITPDEVVDAVLAATDDPRIPIQSVEGFVRQIIGWREFVRGIYRNFGAQQARSNFWCHTREPGAAWWTGETGLPILDDVIRDVLSSGWTHHIPRLMVVANLMNLCEIRPAAAYRWFMEMFVDSAEWVMGPNVYGMGLFSDGGVFATKPYICGSSYLLRMSDYKRGQWCDVVDGLYWRFVGKHREFFAGNPRLSVMAGALDRMSADRKSKILADAEAFLDRVTEAPRA